MHIYLTIFIFVVGVLGCAPKKNDSKPSTREIPPRQKIAAASCFPHPSDDQDSTDLGDPKDLIIPFGKPLSDKSILSYRLKSAEKLWNKLRADGVKVYVFKNGQILQRPAFFNSSEKCDYYFGLPYISRSEQEKWNDGTFAGLFLYGYIGSNREIYESKIYVHEQTSKWTLFHEALHFYFRKSQYAHPDFIPTTEVSRGLDKLLTETHQWIANQVENDQDKVYRVINEGYKYLKYYLIQENLEEMTIEYVISQLYSMGQFGPSLNQYVGGLKYADSEKEEALYLLSVMEKILLNNSSRGNHIQSLLLKNQVTQFKEEISETQNALSQLQWKISLIPSIVPKSSIGSTPLDVHPHLHQDNDLDQKFDNLFKNLERLVQ